MALISHLIAATIYILKRYVEDNKTEDDIVNWDPKEFMNFCKELSKCGLNNNEGYGRYKNRRRIQLTAANVITEIEYLNIQRFQLGAVNATDVAAAVDGGSGNDGSGDSIQDEVVDSIDGNIRIEKENCTLPKSEGRID